MPNTFIARKDYPTAEAPAPPTDHTYAKLEDALQFAYDYVIHGGAESVSITGHVTRPNGTRPSVLQAKVSKGPDGCVAISATYATMPDQNHQ